MAQTLLVLGNGFDLSCGLASSFKNYLNSSDYSATIDKIRGVDEQLSLRLKGSSQFDSSWLRNIHIIDLSLTFWDYYFSLPLIYHFPKDEIDRWCDFEKKMSGFLRSSQKVENTSDEVSEILWTGINDIPRDAHLDKEYKRNLILFLYLNDTYRKLGKTDTLRPEYHLPKLLDDWLFTDLKRYEKRFGAYIYQQQITSPVYTYNAEYLIKKLLKPDDIKELIYLDTFNYTDLSSIVPSTCRIWHINGDYESPIFGIDSSATKNQYNSLFKYSKTSRRLELFNKEVYSPGYKKRTKTVVFGHSLNEQDYSYYYSLFSRLDLSGIRDHKPGKYIQFAYCKHGSEPAEHYRQSIVSRVLSMLERYNDEVLHEPPFRLMDILFCNSVISFSEIDISGLKKAP